MTYLELTDILSVLGWKYPDTIIPAIYESVKYLDLDEEQALRIGMVYNSKPTAKNLVKSLFALSKATTFDFSNAPKLYSVVDTEIDTKEGGIELQKILQHSLIFSFATYSFFGRKMFDEYLEKLKSVRNKTVYEICWIYLEYNKYDFNLQKPEIRLKRLWELYGEKDQNKELDNEI